MPSPNDLANILFHATPDDLPSGIRVIDASDTDTKRAHVFAGASKLATISHHWRKDKPGHYVHWDFNDRENEINTLLDRIANTIAARLAQEKAEANAVLSALNLGGSK